MRLPAKLPTGAIVAIIDTREQTPLDLSPLRTERGTLSTGDYSIRGLESVVSVERKSLDDLLGCCGRDRERFERELDRLRAYPVRALIVEAEWHDIERGEWRSKLTPKQVGASLVSWITRGLPIVMAGNHDRAGRITASILNRAATHRWRELREFANQIETESKAVEA